jgi:hypothetical protein
VAGDKIVTNRPPAWRGIRVDYATALEPLARKLPAQGLMVWYDSVLQYARAAQHPLNKRLAMENLMSRYPAA